MIAITGKCRRLSALFSLLFLFNGLLTSSSSSSSHNGNFPSSQAHPFISRQKGVSETSLEKSIGNFTTHNSSRSSSSDIPLWKKQLPFPLNNKTKTLQRILIPGGSDPSRRSVPTRFGCDVEVFLLGTAHVSKDSSRDVRQLLESVEPDAIFLELCHQRLNLLESSEETGTEDESLSKKSMQTANETRGLWNGLFRRKKIIDKQKNDKHIDTSSFSSIASSLLTNMQGDYADSLEVELGGEFRTAYQYWKTVVPHGPTSYRKVYRHQNVHMILGDRPVTLTLTRAWESLKVWGKIKLMVGLIVSSLRKPNPDELREWMEKILYGDTDLMSESVKDLAKHFPTLAEVILKERDAYMACKLHQTCRRLIASGSRTQSQKRYRLVAIVGAGHVEGICQWLTKGGSVASISTVCASTTTTTSEDSPPLPPDTPEDILSKLIQIKATISQEDHDYLVHQITEVTPELMEEFSA